MFDDLKIRNKLVVLVAGPIVIVLLLTAVGARARMGTVDASRRVERLVAVARANSNVADALQQESIASTGYVGSGRTAWKSDLTKTRKATDLALAESLDRQRQSMGTSSAFRSASTLANDAADKLVSARETVDQGYRWDQVVTTYGSLQRTFLSVNDTIPDVVTNPQVSELLRTGAAVAAYKAAVASQGSLLVGAAEQGGFTTEGSFELLTAAVADGTIQKAILNSIADSARKGDIRDALSSGSSITMETARNEAVTGGADAKVTADPKVLVKASLTAVGNLHGVESGLSREMISESKAGRSSAQNAANLFLVFAIVAVLAAAIGALHLGRRITVPLIRLADAADRLAREQMPRLVESLKNPSDEEVATRLGAIQPIEVTSGDEIGRLTASFNDVQRVAGEVAAEQAALLRKGIGEMFVNLARRNQALLDRQIEFIDELERVEEDPDQLENLYRLDHLATRMRRNAESLLVLAGSEPPRRRGRPAPLANIVRAALAEVEDFGRIDLLSFDEVLIASNAAADLAHLLSELMENATNFSPPEARVEVVGHRTKGGGYVISVTDHGIGMSVDQVLEANESLTNPPLVGLAMSRSLGFIVVGRLAGRHGVAVRMMPSPSGGVTAVVSIPTSLATETVGQADRPPAPNAAEVPKPVADASISTSEGTPVPSGVAPISFTPYDPNGLDNGPATLADAVPTGSAFDAGLEALIGPESTSGPLPRQPDPAGTQGGLPIRRLSAAPPPPAPQVNASEPISFAPEPVDRRAMSFSLDEPQLGPLAPGANSSPDPSVVAQRQPVGFEGPLPEAVDFALSGSDMLEEPPEAAAVDGDHLDGPPPSIAGLAIRPTSVRPAVPAAPDSGLKPFFLEEAGPPRLFGRTPVADVAPAIPSIQMSTTAEPLISPAPEAASGLPVRSEVKGLPAVPTHLVAPGAPSTGDWGERISPERDLTNSGLTKRSPRQAGDSGRAIPGADAERGVSATRRSPDEVRSLLSRYRDGQQRARAEESVPAGPPEEKETP